MEILISELLSGDKDVQSFKEKEWQIADLEHYGRDVDLQRRDYEFCARSEDGDVLGVVEMNVQGDLANITTLLVNSQKRKMGVGRALMEKAEKLAVGKGCKKIWLETNEGWGAEYFYAKLGYEIEAKLERHIFNQNSLIFVKFLGS